MSGDEANYRLRGLGEVDFRRALREIDLPLTESDARRLFMHFEVRDVPLNCVAQNNESLRR